MCESSGCSAIVYGTVDLRDGLLEQGEILKINVRVSNAQRLSGLMNIASGFHRRSSAFSSSGQRSLGGSAVGWLGGCGVGCFFPTLHCLLIFVGYQERDCKQKSVFSSGYWRTKTVQSRDSNPLRAGCARGSVLVIMILLIVSR